MKGGQWYARTGFFSLPDSQVYALWLCRGQVSEVDLFGALPASTTERVAGEFLFRRWEVACPYA